MKLLLILGYLATAFVCFTLGLGFAIGFDSPWALVFVAPLVPLFVWLLPTS